MAWHGSGDGGGGWREDLARSDQKSPIRLIRINISKLSKNTTIFACLASWLADRFAILPRIRGGRQTLSSNY